MIEHCTLVNGLEVTARDQEVLNLLSQGSSNNDIATDLKISPRTVKQHIRIIAMRNGIKTEANSRSRLRVLLVLAWKDDGPSEDNSIARAAWDKLSNRQREAASWAAKGYTNKEVGVKMGTSEQMVKNHLRLIFDELGVWTRLELAVWYRAHIVERLTPVVEPVQ